MEHCPVLSFWYPQETLQLFNTLSERIHICVQFLQLAILCTQLNAHCLKFGVKLRNSSLFLPQETFEVAYRHSERLDIICLLQIRIILRLSSEMLYLFRCTACDQILKHHGFILIWKSLLDCGHFSWNDHWFTEWVLFLLFAAIAQSFN